MFFFLKGVSGMTDHAKVRLVCLDTDVSNTVLVAIYNARCNPLPDPSIRKQDMPSAALA